MSVDFTLPEYDDAKKKWALIRAIVDNNASHYIPDVDKGDPDRSVKYRNNGILTNFTGLTKSGLQGLVFLKPPEIKLPSALNYLLKDATGSGLGLEQLAQQVCGEVLETGRHGLLVDFPRVDQDLSMDDLETGQYVARFLPYTAESIINWRTARVNGKSQLTLVVLREVRDEIMDDGFEIIKKDYYRVLKLEGNEYYQELYNEKQELVDVVQPIKSSGTAFDYIPFVFIGAENNDPVIDNAPLYDLATLNLGMYKNSCDYEESVYICGQPTVVINVGDIPADQWSELNGGKFKYGSRGGHVVGLGGNATLLQANPNNLAGQAIKDKIEQATLMGARFIMGNGSTRETAEGARIRYSSQNSSLYVLTKNESNAFELLITMACDFVKGANPLEGITFALNDKFYDDGVDPLLLAQGMLMIDRNVITPQEMRDYIAAPEKGLVTNAISTVEIDNVDPTSE